MHTWLSTLAAVGALATAAGTPIFAVDGHVVAAGSSVRAISNCYALAATIAEPVAGFSASADYTLSAGYAAASGFGNDSLFANSFEDCSQ